MLNDIDALAKSLRECREYTLAMYGHLVSAQWQVPLLEIVNPPYWELAHIAFFQEFFCLRCTPADPQGLDRASRMPGADAMFDSRTVPHDARWHLDYPSRDDLWRYMEATLADTLDALSASRDADRHRFRLALFHEDMHGEALLMTLQTLGLPAPTRPHVQPPGAVAPPSGDIHFEGGEFLQGVRRGALHAFDNEKWAHPVHVAPFAIASAPVTSGEYAAFVEDGGYGREALWTPAGWQWRAAAALDAPRHWRRAGAGWQARWFDRWQALEEHDPLVHVSRHEAEAYCAWAGRRLPTESEWEFAATAGGEPSRYPWGEEEPVGAMGLDYRLDRPRAGTPDFRPVATGLRQVLGGVWEWTSSPFEPYPGFETDAYAEYSAPWFHSHGVLRGGCFATRSRLVHSRWRNFYLPHRNDIFAGFRTCARAPA